MSSPTVRAVDPSPSQCFLAEFSPLDTRLNMSAVIFGSNAAWLLLGFIFAQTYAYYRHSARDPLTLKVLVYSLVFIVVAQRGADDVGAYGLLVSGWGNSLIMSVVNTTAIASDLQILFAALPAIFVQIFFTWRIWTFCMAVCGRRMKLVVAAACLLIVCTGICALISAITLCGILMSPVFYPDFLLNRFVFIWTVSTAAADVSITAIMMAILYHAKSGAYFGETRDRISHLLRLTLQTGFLTSVLALPVAPLFSTEPHGGIHALTTFVLGGSYVISLLANLNTRSYHTVSSGHARDSDNISTPPLSTLRFTTGQHRNRESTGESSARTGILSAIRSVVHTIRRDLAETPDERTSRMEREAQLTNLEGDVSSTPRNVEGSSGEAPI